MVGRAKSVTKHSKVNNIVYRCQLHTLGDSLQYKGFSVPIFGKHMHKGYILVGNAITSRTIIVLNNKPHDIVIIVEIYEVANPKVFKSRGDYFSYEDYHPKLIWKMPDGERTDISGLVKPLIVEEHDAIRLIEKALCKKRKPKDATIVKIIMKCFNVPDKYIANMLFSLFAIKSNTYRPLPLYLLALPFYEPEVEYNEYDRNDMIRVSLVQLFDYVWPYSGTLRMTKKCFLQCLKDIGCLGMSWIKSKCNVNIELINKLCLLIWDELRKGVIVADLLGQILNGLLVEMQNAGAIVKCGNPDCPKYFKKTKKPKKHCSLSCAKHVHYLKRLKSGCYHQSRLMKRKRDYMKEYRKS